MVDIRPGTPRPGPFIRTSPNPTSIRGVDMPHRPFATETDKPYFPPTVGRPEFHKFCKAGGGSHDRLSWFRDRTTRTSSLPPIGLGYLSSHLTNHGVDTKIIDGLAMAVRPSQLKYLVKRLLDYRIVGSYRAAKATAEPAGSYKVIGPYRVRGPRRDEEVDAERAISADRVCTSEEQPASASSDRLQFELP